MANSQNQGLRAWLDMRIILNLCCQICMFLYVVFV